MLLSIITSFNDKEILEEYLLNSLKNQNIDFELILIDNTKNKFKCAADALNYGGDKAKGDLLIFVHSDVKFLDNSLKTIIYYCNNLDNFGIAGVAGISELNNGKVRSNSFQGNPPTPISKYHLKTIENAQTLDELMLIIPKNIFDNYKFDNKTCTHWHLHGHDYCLQLLRNGYKVYILPIEVYHLSDGKSFSIEYYSTLKKILNKYKNDFDRVYTTCLFSHNPHNQLKLNILFCLEMLHLRNFLIRLLSKIISLKNLYK